MIRKWVRVSAYCIVQVLAEGLAIAILIIVNRIEKRISGLTDDSDSPLYRTARPIRFRTLTRRDAWRRDLDTEKPV